MAYKDKEKAKAYRKWYHQEHREEELAYGKEHSKQYYQEHREQILAQAKQYWQKHREERLVYKKAYRQEHKEEIMARHKQYYQEHRNEISVYNKKWKREHKSYDKKWRKDNPDRFREIDKKHHNKRDRNLGFIPLNQYFEGLEAHHIDKERIIYIPKEYHRSITHNLETGKNMPLINAIAWDYLIESKIAEEN